MAGPISKSLRRVMDSVRAKSNIRPASPIQPRQPSRAVAQDIDAGFYPIEHREPEVVQRGGGFSREANVAAGFEGAAAAAGEEDRQVVVVVAVAVGNAAAVGDHAMVEQCAVSFVD